jgi:outer membrane protein
VDTDGAEAVNSFGLNLNQYNNFFDAATFGLTFKF